MSHSQYTAKSHHLQWSMPQITKFCRTLYRNYCPDSIKHRRNIKLAKVFDESILVLLVIQAELGITSQRHFYKICRLISCGTLLERSRFNRRARQLIWIFQLIRQAMNGQIPSETVVIMDSFPLPLCQTIRNHRTKIFKEIADIGYNASKNMWFYGFKVHMLVTLSGYIINYVVTPASVHDIKAVQELLEGCKHSVILADLGYLSKELKEELAERGYKLWTPVRRNMKGAKQWNDSKIAALRRTIETRFSKLCRKFNVEHTLSRGLTGLQLRIEQIMLSYNLDYFEIN